MVNQIAKTIRNVPNFYVGQRTNYYYMKTILIAEDDTDNRELLRMILEMWDYRVVEAKDGIEALRLTQEVCPDLILMDLRLPFVDGLDVTRQIRESAVLCHTPIIFVSGCAELKYRHAANQVGANAYFVKPLDFNNLQLIIAKQLNFSL